MLVDNIVNRIQIITKGHQNKLLPPSNPPPPPSPHYITTYCYDM